jgi:hypothetical protein
MKLVALYHPQSETARTVEEFAKEFERSRGQSIELVSLETKEGAEMARLYDIVRYPAILAIRDEGQVAAQWQGDMLPLMDEVSGYLER